MNWPNFLSDLWHTQRPLVLSGAGFLVLFLVLAIVSLFDSTQILAVNRWVKPTKFAISISIFLWTIAVYLYYLPGHEKASGIIAWGVIACMVGEIMLITMQALRGTTSHFNFSTAFGGLVFSVMGVMIAASSLLIGYLTVLYFRTDFELPTAIVWGMRLGLIVFLLASIEGGYMASQIGHTVGAADGGAGLPFVNWSVTAGDLRIAHFLGLHALQVIPIAALLFVWLPKSFFRFRQQFRFSVSLLSILSPVALFLCKQSRATRLSAPKILLAKITAPEI